ncbi:MAG: hypothetical protein WBM69_21070 [Desulfobacterales bacterium]
MRKTTLFIILAVILLIPAYVVAGITDEFPVNFYWANTQWDYRDYGNYGTSNFTGGSQMRTGAGYLFECEIRPGGLLGNVEDVKKVEAVNTLTKKHYILHYDPFFWPSYGRIMDYWELKVQPDDSMFEGNWKFVLYYQGIDGQKHRQVLITTPPAKTFPPEIAHVTVNRSGDSFEVSWSGIGPPNPPLINYRVLVFPEGSSDVIEDIRGDWQGGGSLTTGTYDTNLNKVTFTIPGIYGGEAYGIRLATSMINNRSLYYMVLPPF